MARAAVLDGQSLHIELNINWRLTIHW